MENMSETIHLEIRNQTHQMDFEGTSDNEPSHASIIDAVENRFYKVKLGSIEVFHDDLQGFWRFNGDLA